MSKTTRIFSSFTIFSKYRFSIYPLELKHFSLITLIQSIIQSFSFFYELLAENIIVVIISPEVCLHPVSLPSSSLNLSKSSQFFRHNKTVDIFRNQTPINHDFNIQSLCLTPLIRQHIIKAASINLINFSIHIDFISSLLISFMISIAFQVRLSIYSRYLDQVLFFFSKLPALL